MQQHSQSPKKRKLVLFFTYGVMTMAVALISAVCIFLVLGYRFDFKNGDVEQGALLQFRSFPSGATINLDNETLSFVTPGKRNISLGQHNVTMGLDGYEFWKKTFSVKASELRWLNYARLVPKEIKTTDVKEFAAIAGLLPSPDKKWMILSPVAEKPEFTLVDIRDEDKPAFASLNLPAGSYTQKEGHPHKFSLVEWDFGARYVLVKHEIGDVSEYLRIDRTDADSTVNISNVLGLKLTDIHFSGTSGAVFYALENGAIRRLDSNSGTISQPIVRDVSAFEVFKTETLSYVKQPINDRVGVGIVVNGKASRVATYDNSLPIFVDVNEYFNDYYFAIARGTQVELYKDPESRNREKLKTTTSPTALAWTQFSNNGRFVVAGNGSQFTTYDIETNVVTDVNLPGTVASPTEPLQWLDDYYMVSTADNSLRITEFDGANQHVITPSVSGFPVTLNGNGKLMYSLGKTQSGAFVLQSSRMTIEE
ncbi:MAG: WD40 repeat domain-containing protein [Candidatus Saccharimonadales bacterium]